MLHKRIYLDATDERVYIDTYVTDLNFKNKDAMLVIPGGGYQGVCHDREGEPVALAYVAKGYNAFVLNYRVGSAGDTFPKQLIDASRAIVYIREHAEELSVNPDRIFAVGFSAGGHLAGSLATMYDEPEVRAALGISGDENKPTGCVLSYPVVTANTDNTHKSSFEMLLGKKFDDITVDERVRFSLETRVTDNSAPLFVWHTAEDALVPAEGSLRLINEYVKRKIPVQAAIYPYGPHGLALSKEMTAKSDNHIQPIAAAWVDDSIEWMKTL